MKYTLLLALACACLGVCHASIDQSPQVVGPKYFFESNGQSMNLEAPSTTEKPAANEVEPEVDAPMTVRRVVLMPAFTRTLISSSGSGDDQSSSPDDFPRFMRPPSLFPLLFPQHFMRDFRSPFASSSSEQDPLTAATSSSVNNGEREDTTKDSQGPNPIDLLLDMMTKALRSHAMSSSASAQPEAESNADKSLEKPDKSVSESQEEVVTINGRKYLKKSIVTRHFGDHLMFLTRRLVFTPIDELEGSTNATTTTTTTEAPSNTEAKSASTTLAPTTESANKQTTEASTRQTEETTPSTTPLPKNELSSVSDKVIESELIKPAGTIASTASFKSEKPTTGPTSSQPDDKPVPSSEPDFVRT